LHVSQELAPLAETVLTAQSLHTPAATPLYFPAKHREQLAASAKLNFPGSQSWHSEDPLELHRPAGQLPWQLAEASSDTLPAGQTLQLSAAAGE